MKKGQEPAFPFIFKKNTEEFIDGIKTSTIEITTSDGMNKRFYAACAAMQGLLASPAIKIPQYESIIKTAYIFADELLNQENNELT